MWVLVLYRVDDNVVYTLPDLSKTTKPIRISEISLSNFSLLKIEYSNNGGWNNRCCIFDVSVYN